MFQRCFILFYSILFYSILFCSVLFCSVLFCSVLFCSVLFCSVLFCSVLFCSVLFYSILFYSILFYSILFYSILFILFSGVLICKTQQIACLNDDVLTNRNVIEAQEVAHTMQVATLSLDRNVCGVVQQRHLLSREGLLLLLGSV